VRTRTGFDRFEGSYAARRRMWREIFPRILAQLADRGVIEITITDEEVSLRMPNAPQLGVYRVERKRTFH
jgi:hypothetical protein